MKLARACVVREKVLLYSSCIRPPPRWWKQKINTNYIPCPPMFDCNIGTVGRIFDRLIFIFYCTVTKNTFISLWWPTQKYKTIALISVFWSYIKIHRVIYLFKNYKHFLIYFLSIFIFLSFSLVWTTAYIFNFIFLIRLLFGVFQSFKIKFWVAYEL